jgi:hypothetical protein
MPRRKAKLRRAIMSSPLANAAKRVLYGRFYKLQRGTEGLLSPAAYKHIHERMRSAPDLDSIEIGGASGSASIAIAWAKMETGQSSKHIVVEKCEGGSRDKYGGFEDNLARFNRHLAEFGAAGKVEIFPHYLTPDNGQQVKDLVTTGQIGGLMCDADGRLDRDFALFLPLVHPQGPIIIDDYHPSRTWKHAMTWRLLNQFIEWKLFVLEERAHGMAFGRPHQEADVARIDPDVCADIIDSVRTDFRVSDRLARLYFRHGRTASAA